MWKALGLTFVNRLCCVDCSCISEKVEHLFTLPIDLPASACSIEVLLANQWGNQALKEGDDPYCCPREPPCSAAAVVRRSVTPTVWPQTLILSLKRFRSEFEDGVIKVKKVLTHVSFETLLLVQNDMMPYHLKGVIQHHGRHAAGGHYNCHVRASDNHWYSCDDHRRPVRNNTDEVLKAQAYVLV